MLGPQRVSLAYGRMGRAKDLCPRGERCMETKNYIPQILPRGRGTLKELNVSTSGWLGGPS